MAAMDEQLHKGVGAAIGRIPSGLFILTAQHEDQRTGMLVSWVQQVCFEPPTVCVAIGKGRPILPFISESRRFALCQLPKGDRILLKRFASGVEPGEDPMLGLDMVGGTVTGVPVMSAALAYLECELVSHLDVDGDHDLFVGRVVGGGFMGGEPDVRVRTDGFIY